MKWSTLAYKQKKRVLWLLALLLLVFCYQYGFRRTLAVYDDYQNNKLKAGQFDEYSSLAPFLREEEKKINTLIQKNLWDTLATPKETLAYIGDFSKQHSLRLVEYQPMQITEGSSFNIATSQAVVEGSYKSLLKLIYELENHENYGRLCSAFFKSTEDTYSGKTTLTCTFYLQNLIRK